MACWFVAFELEKPDDELQFLNQASQQHELGDNLLFVLHSGYSYTTIIVDLKVYHTKWFIKTTSQESLFAQVCKKKPNATQSKLATTVHCGYASVPNGESLECNYKHPFEYVGRINAVAGFQQWASECPRFVKQELTLELQTLAQRIDQLEQDKCNLQTTVDQLQSELNQYKKSRGGVEDEAFD